MNKLPMGWVEVELKNLISQNGLISDGDWVESKDQDENGNIRLIQLADIGDGDFKDKSSRFMNLETAKKLRCTFLKENDVLIARMPDPLGRACLFPKLNQDCVTVVDVCLVRLDETSAITPNLLKYWINNNSIRNEIALNATGTTRKRITRKKLEDLILPLPPKAEQDHIATLLDNHLSQVATISQKLNDILPIIKQFRQSVLAQAVSGKLTKGWRKENNLDFNWCKLSIQDVATVKTGKTPSRKEEKYWANGVVSWATSSATGSDFCYYTDEKISQIAVDECNLKPFPKGSLLLAMYGEGKTRGQVTELMIEATCNQACAVLIVDNDIALTGFIKLKLKENYERTRQLASGGNQPNLNLNKVREIELKLPPLAEQQQIVTEVERLFAVANSIETQVKEALERVGHLTQSILHQAFTGNLSADWRACNADLITGEHSATALLAKIQDSKQPTKRKKADR